MAAAAEMYVQELFTSGAPKAQATAALAGVAFFSPLHSPALRMARKLLKGSARFEPSQQRPPMPAFLAYLIAHIWAQQGHLDRAVAILLAFDAYLRVSELVGINVADIDRTHRSG
jgi:hypothetical protein